MSYEQLLNITKEAREMRREDDERELVDCPVCGEVLDENKDGWKNCPLGHFRAAPGTRAREVGG